MCFDDITTSLNQSLWGVYSINGYQDFSIQAHDGGHGSIGPTMQNQDVSSYDPVFWFFHCNIDRLWLCGSEGRCNETGRVPVHGSPPTPMWFTTRLQRATPFTTTTRGDDRVRDLVRKAGGVPPAEVTLENMFGSIEAARSFSIKRSTPVSVRVKDIDRLNIPGSFVVSLLADGEPIAKRSSSSRRHRASAATARRIRW